ncbi:MAG: hypothetical protein WCD18_21040 [Thermosynechococcaceae cyanobacterium]
MTQTQPDRVDQLESLIERIDRKLDTIASDIIEIKISQARTDERLNSLEVQVSDIKKNTDTQFADIKTQIRAQDARLWTFVTGLIIAVVGLLAKFLFFPQA